MSGRGLFITFEGGDGCGKTTQADIVANHLHDDGHQVLRTREPGGSPIGLEIRKMVLHSTEKIHPRAEALLFAADRAQNINVGVTPALERGIHVVQDRYIDSSLAYQGAGRGLPAKELRDISMWAANGLLPDLTVLLDLDPEVAASRTSARGKADRIEAEKAEFRERMRAEFLQIAADEPERFLIVDASLQMDEITGLILVEVDLRLQALRNI